MGGVLADDGSESLLRRRIAICGVLVDRVDRAGACAAIDRFLDSGGGHQIVTVTQTSRASPKVIRRP